LVRSPNAKLGELVRVPTGDWIICGFGRMGQWFYRHFVQNGINPVIIDPKAGKVDGAAQVINSHANRESLQAAGLDQAVGVVAGTDNDHDNLAILMSVNAIKPDAFTIVRQNSHENQVAFNAVKADLVLQSSLTTARRVLKHLISPQVHTFIEYLREKGEDICEQAVQRLKSIIGENSPYLWQVKICEEEAAAVVAHLQRGASLSLGELRRDPHNLDGSLPCMPFSVVRAREQMMLPKDDFALLEGDEILFCGTEQGEIMLSATMNNAYILDYLRTGEDRPRGYVFKWLISRRRSASAFT
jgi:Trk K+ transport system NAD-binding subunit